MGGTFPKFAVFNHLNYMFRFPESPNTLLITLEEMGSLQAGFRLNNIMSLQEDNMAFGRPTK